MKAATYIRRPDIVVKDMGDAVLLYSAEQEAIHVLNPVAQFIWELCDGQHTIDDMERTIRARFSASDEHDVLGDVRQTLETFAAKGLLEPE